MNLVAALPRSGDHFRICQCSVFMKIILFEVLLTYLDVIDKIHIHCYSAELSFPFSLFFFLVSYLSLSKIHNYSHLHSLPKNLLFCCPILQASVIISIARDNYKR